MKLDTPFALARPPKTWTRLGIAIERGTIGSFDSSVTGDPCIVWDENESRYRMFYFAQKHVGQREINANAHALGCFDEGAWPKNWQKLGLIQYVNPDALLGDAHKPWILMDPYRPNTAAQVKGKYWLFMGVCQNGNKRIQLATANSLAGPWEIQTQSLLDPDDETAFDSYHHDTPTAYWFESDQQIVLFYKGYPRRAQPDQPHSPFGSSNAVAIMTPADTKARKLGKVIAPMGDPNHWLSGWVGGLQIFPASGGGWFGLLNGSPTPPAPVEVEPEFREPAPSLGGWAHTAEKSPVSGWRIEDTPIERIEDISIEAKNNGEGMNFWRHHGLVCADGNLYLFYNTGPYGNEQMFIRSARIGTETEAQV